MSENKRRYFLHDLGGVYWAARPDSAPDYENDRTMTEVQVVPLDAIVIRRDELPEVLPTATSGFVRIDGFGYGTRLIEGYTDHRAAALRRLALIEYLRERPPIDEARVKALLPALQSISGYDLATEEGRYYAAQDLVAERGVRVETP